MKKENIILLFSDLEGTILNEADGEYSDENMFRFLEQIDQLQKETNARVKIHIVSPIYMNQMEKIVDQVDKNFYSYNRTKNDLNCIDLVECAGAYPEDSSINYRTRATSKVIPLKKPITNEDYDLAKFGKANYVKTWIDIYKENELKNFLMCVYCGNGRNDLDAMKYLRKRNQGYIICPRNSRTEARNIANFVSEKRELAGITDGLNQLNICLSKKSEFEKDKSQKEFDITR